MAAPMFYNIDDEAAFNECQSQLRSSAASCLLVYFNDDVARAATNLSRQQLEFVLQNRHQEDAQGQCLWINLWGWSAEHHEIVNMIAQEYDVSQRLAHMICPKPSEVPGSSSTSGNRPTSDSSQLRDVEMAKFVHASSSGSGDTSPGRRKDLRSIGDVVNDLWHFYSFDIGRRYISLSWNGLFFSPGNETPSETHKPHAIRIWSSLLLFDDGTILSVFESPSNCPPAVVERIRFNQLNIFRHLSKASPPHTIQNPLMQISVRSSSQRTKSSITDLAGLMLYYLFDDWVNIYAQVAGGSESYRNRLDQIRDQMIGSPNVDQVKTLHSLGRQLVVLKSIYRSYQAIIERVIQRVRVSAAQDTMDIVRRSENTMQRTMTAPSVGEHTMESERNESVNLHESRVRLSPAAIVRFERLKDRIEICALTEVEECLKEKEAMVLMNFNLIQLSESRAIEKLTRTTILLAKVTILFLPLSLVSGYFSLQFEAIDQLYSLRTFWLTFMVVAIITILFLVGSNALGFRYKERRTYRNLFRNFLARRKGNGP
jgi:Mg2+ and Co2+ transporter CorA